MNLPNKLATLRIILVVPFVFILSSALKSDNGTYELFMRIIAFIIFAIAAITDYFDGKIAREQNMVTNLGKLLDPLADKILVISTMVVFVKFDKLSLWIVLIIIFRELLITGLRSIVAAEGIVIAAETLGKLKTVTQMIALSIIILFSFTKNVNSLIFVIPLILTVQSGYEYLIKSKIF